MIKKISIDGLLSFDKFELELRNLNVLIGPNGSGKSNLIHLLGLLRVLPDNPAELISRGGGIREWLRKPPAGETGTLKTETVFEGLTVHHEIALAEEQGRLRIPYERFVPMQTNRPDTEFTAYEVQNGEGTYAAEGNGVLALPQKPLLLKDRRRSALTEVRWLGHPLRSLSLFGELLEGIRLYLNIGFGTGLPAREWQPADQPVDFLEEDITNLALVLQNTFINSSAEKSLNEEFSLFFERFRRFGVSIFGNQVLLNMHEKDLTEPVPATRWSDGMVRYLCLLTILCHPEPPPLICIDEPELGFHPDILPNLARLIKSCAERTQVIITTHSAELVDQFSDDPEAVVVCERDFDGATRMERLPAKRLEKWLTDYTLGDLWRRGEIGGNPS